MTKKPIHPMVRQRKTTSGLRSLVTTSNRLSAIVMSVTVGGLLILVLLQGSLFWPLNARSGRKILVSHLKGKLAWDEQREKFLKLVRGKDSGQNNMCSYFPRRTTAKKHWTNFIGVVLASSQHPDDKNFIHEDWTKRLLSELPPSVLVNTLHSAPPEEDIQRILDIVLRKFQNPETAPPLRIAVVGGTFAEGEGCAIASVAVPDSSIMANPSFCAWPYRLQAFLNTLMGGIKWVEVTNMSEEGTDSAFITPLVRNWIYPKNLLPHGPDIIVNAYGRYDYETYGAHRDAAVDEIIRLEMDAFLQAVEASHPCGSKPMVIHMDDVGVSLTKSKSIFSIRHHDAFEKAMAADSHTHKDFAMAGHMVMTWVLAFSMLEVSLQHCAKKATQKLIVPKEETVGNCHDPSTGDSSCPFAFFAGPMGTVRKVPEMQKYIEPFLAHINGWKVLSEMSTGWSRKTALVAVEPNALVLFKIPSIQKEVRYFHLMTLKSNGAAWKDGRARFRVAILDRADKDKASMEAYFDIDGYHDNDTDITYHFSVDLGVEKAPIGSDIMLSVEMLQGTGFKILGLMLCS